MTSSFILALRGEVDRETRSVALRSSESIDLFNLYSSEPNPDGSCDCDLTLTIFRQDG